jgi:hypothetical protein
MFKPIKRVVITAIVVLAVSGPSIASARFDLNPGTSISTQPQPIAQAQQRVEQRSAPQPSLSRAVRSQDGFRWSDAGIGAAGVLILLSGGMVALGASRRRRASDAAIG